jgi:hypothetical protein
MITDIHGNQYHVETRYNSHLTGEDGTRLIGEGQDPSLVMAKKILVDESGNPVTEPIDVGSHLYVPHPNGPYMVAKVVESDNQQYIGDSR